MGWILSAFFFLDAIFSGLALQRMGDASVRLGIKLRASLMTEVFRKTFRLKQQNNEDQGNVVSLARPPAPPPTHPLPRFALARCALSLSAPRSTRRPHPAPAKP